MLRKSIRKEIHKSLDRLQTEESETYKGRQMLRKRIKKEIQKHLAQIGSIKDKNNEKLKIEKGVKGKERFQSKPKLF